MRSRGRARRAGVAAAVLGALAATARADGTVQVSSDGDRVTLTGDDADNSLEIGVEGSALVIRGAGSTVLGDDGLTELSFPIGETLPTVAFRGEEGADSLALVARVGDVRFEGGTGDDRLAFRESDRMGAVSFAGGPGADTAVSPNNPVVDRFDFSGGAGDDEVDLQGATFLEGINVRMDSGDDRFRLQFVAVKVSLRVDGGPGDDRLSVHECELPAETRLRDGTGNDVLDLEGSRAPGLLRIRCGRGEDLVDLQYSELPRGVVVRAEIVDMIGSLPGGPVNVDLTTTPGGPPGSFRAAATSFPSSLTVHGGRGRNAVEMNTSSVDGAFTFLAPRGFADGSADRDDDFLSLGSTFGGGLGVRLEEGRDRVRIFESTFLAAGRFLCGDGDDEVAFTDPDALPDGPTHLGASLLLDGGAGTDAIVGGSNVEGPGSLVLLGFEGGD